LNVTDNQIREAAAATVEVLSGCDQQRERALMEKLLLAKSVLAMVAAGQLVIGQPAQEPVKEVAKKRK
jgi:hypothetical protein